MKKIMALLFTTFISSFAYSDGLLALVQYPVGKQDLIALSMQHAKAKLCQTCQAVELNLTAETTFYEHNDEIDFQKAMELFVKKPHEIIYLSIDRNKSIVESIVFGIQTDSVL